MCPPKTANFFRYHFGLLEFVSTTRVKKPATCGAGAEKNRKGISLAHPGLFYTGKIFPRIK